MLQNVSKTYARNFIFGAGGGKTNFQSKGTVAAATKLQDWAKSGYFTNGYAGLGYDPSWQAFGKGTGVFLISGSWLTADLKKALGKNVGFFLLPPAKGKALATLGGEGLPWAISSKSKNADAAATYLNFITSNSSMQVVGEQRPAHGDEGEGEGAGRASTPRSTTRGRRRTGGRDRPVPRLGDADDVRHDHGGDPGADRRARRRRRRSPRRFSPTTRSSTRAERLDEQTEPASAALALRRPARLRRPRRRASSRRARRAGSATSTCCRRSRSTPRSCSLRSGTRSGSRCTSGTG